MRYQLTNFTEFKTGEILHLPCEIIIDTDQIKTDWCITKSQSYFVSFVYKENSFSSDFALTVNSEIGDEYIISVIYHRYGDEELREEIFRAGGPQSKGEATIFIDRTPFDIDEKHHDIMYCKDAPVIKEVDRNVLKCIRFKQYLKDIEEK